ncbi:MAG: endolytic transglycosylase MltG [Gammaproteobacteria bacterium]
MLKKAFFLLVLGFIVAVVPTAWWLNNLRNPVTPPQDYGGLLTVLPGESLSRLLSRLSNEGWQLPTTQIKLYARFYQLDHQIRAGDYPIQNCCSSSTEWLDLLTSGQQLTHRITLIEGWDFAQISAALRAEPKIADVLSDEAYAAAHELRMGYESAEGLFFPDTYDYASGESDRDILKRARKRQRDLVQKLWQERPPGLPYETPYDAIILASIVERETASLPEAPQIAGVYVSRLRKGWRLEADPTVIYGLGNDYTRRLTLTDLRTQGPWNTYKNYGLPPTPISTPSENSLRAALAPVETGAMYFVAKGDGTHLFSRTLAEHHQNIKTVRAKRRQARTRK